MSPPIDLQLKEALEQFPQILLAVLFGSAALGRQRPKSDLDIAVAGLSCPT